ncbi:lipopolysaccharide biosynthesis protein [Rudanella lutea]|uniref:lipopolysaccharide biosynthesis protein n=1 Tax=Rudanella lutea TaxID=451374 RepID=UPI0003794A4E|nr:hypothetical protein [Rudanella lutea]
MLAVINALRFRQQRPANLVDGAALDGAAPSSAALESKINRSIVVSFGVRFLSIAVTFLFIPLAIQTLSRHEFGIWMVLFSMVNWLAIVETAVINYLRNELIACFVADDTDRAGQVVASAVATAALIALVLVGVAGVAYLMGGLSPLLSLLSINEPGVQQAFGVVLVGHVLQMMMKLYNGVLLADHKVYLTSVSLLTCNLISFVAILLLAYFQINSLLVFSAIQSFMPIVVYGGFLAYGFRTTYARLMPNLGHWAKVRIGSVLSRSGSFFVLQLVSTLMFTSGSLVVARYFSATEVTTYAVTAKYYSLIPTIYGIVIAPYWSAFAEAFLKRDRLWITGTMSRLHRFCVATVVVAAGMLLMSNVACQIWLGNAVTIPFELAFAFTVYSGAYVLLSNYNYYTNAVGRLRLATVVSAVGCVLFFPLNYLFIEVLGLGLSGVVWVSTAWCLLLTLCCRYEYQKSLATL